MSEHNVAVVDDRAAARKHRVGFGREAGDQVSTHGNVGAGGFQTRDKIDGYCAVVAALHPFENHVVPRLEREMDVRHQARFVRE